MPSLKQLINVMQKLRNHLLIFCFFIMISAIACIQQRKLTSMEINRIADETAYQLKMNKITPISIKNIKFGKSGHCYLLDFEGTVISHPTHSVEGINFSGIPMIINILKKRSGCYIHFFDGKEKIIIFRNAEPHGILCLSISSNEVEFIKENCERFE